MQSGKLTAYLGNPMRLVPRTDEALYAGQAVLRGAEMQYVYGCHTHLIETVLLAIAQRSRADAAN